ncbi:MAG: ATP-binding cassette domain-containing protein [Treponema sp.]|nr:ATP-binding cassette domain-containing protein [Treponema sp.]
MTIETRELTKNYPLKTALDNVSVTFADGKIHALVGENGAGKSTLVALLAGDLQPSAGEILLDGTPVHFATPKDALAQGIVLVHQRPMLASALTAKENIILQLQSTRTKKPFFLHAPTAEMLTLRNEWTPALNLNALVKDLGGNLRFYTSLLGALLQHPRVLMLDEPSAFLDMDERLSLYMHLRSLADTGTNIIVITHSPTEATTYTDTITHLHDGKIVEGGSLPLAPKQVAPRIVPASSADSLRFVACPLPPLRGKSPVTPPSSLRTPRSPALALTDVSARPKNRPALLSATIAAEYGEITAVTGLQEAAMDTLEDTVTGMQSASAKGMVTLTDGSGSHTIRANKLSPQFLRQHGAAIVPSDRTFRAAHPKITVEQLLSVYTKSDTRAKSAALIAEAGVNITPDQLVSNLSGGMLQRLILTRELSARPRLLILCNPMQGLDTQAQANLQKTLTDLAAQEKAILILGTQDFPLSLCHKVYRLEAGKTELVPAPSVQGATP